LEIVQSPISILNFDQLFLLSIENKRKIGATKVPLEGMSGNYSIKKFKLMGAWPTIVYQANLALNTSNNNHNTKLSAIDNPHLYISIHLFVSSS